MSGTALDLLVDHSAAQGALAAVADRVGSLIRTADVDRPVPRLGWTVGDVARHLGVAVDIYAEAISGRESRWLQAYLSGPDATPARIAEGNARALQQVPPREARALADQLAAAMGALLHTTKAHPATAPVSTPWFGPGQSRSVGLLTCLALGELIVHGYDIAQAVGARWPIAGDHARLALLGAASMIPVYVNPQAARGVVATYLIAVRGGPRWAVRFRDGAASIEQPQGRIDCHLSVDPVAFLLVAYGRVSQWSPITRGQLLAWGRRPWLGFKFTSLLFDP